MTRHGSHITLDDEWQLDDDGMDILLLGPGQLEITLKDF